MIPPPPQHLYGLRTLSPIESLETLYRLASRIPPDEAIVELGTFRGASAIWMAAGATAGMGAHVWTIDPHDLPGHRTTTGLGPGTIAYEDPNIRLDAIRQIDESGYADHITMIRGFSVDEAERWRGPQVGLLFIDGDHREHAARLDLRSWQPHLSRNAVVCFDDYAGSHPGVPAAVEKLVERHVLLPPITYGRIAVTATIPSRERPYFEESA